VKSAVPHPKTMGIIRECGGKMHLNEENWEEARADFSESFRSYDEAGSLQRITILKYLCLTTMLMGSDINPFDSQETQPYRNDPMIAPMVDLVDAYQHDEIHRYESILQKNKGLLDDEFINENIEEVNRSMRMKAVIKLIAPYTCFTLEFIATSLKISIREVQDIVGFLIVDKKLKGKIDQDSGTVERDREGDVERIEALKQWSAAVKVLWSAVLNEGDGFRAEDTSLMSGPMGGGMSFDEGPRASGRVPPAFSRMRGPGRPSRH